MQNSLNTLTTASTARLMSAPVAPKPTSPLGINEAILESLRQRNAALDWLFYDVGVITDDEARSISTWLAAEGAILIVPPSHGAALRRCASVDEFASMSRGDIRTLVVAGVGSSALGAAALARNVADALGAPVAAVVSGYGLADIAAEALGGFLLFGAANAVRHSFEWLDRLRESGVIADPATSTSNTDSILPRHFSKDTRTVQALLLHPALSFDLLLGHSKGNMVLSEALFGIRATDPERLKTLAQAMRIVTLSAKIAMPLAFPKIIDVMGELDGFGAMNSRRDIPTDVKIPRAWHHTNTELPWHLPVTACMTQLRADGLI